MSWHSFQSELVSTGKQILRVCIHIYILTCEALPPTLEPWHSVCRYVAMSLCRYVDMSICRVLLSYIMKHGLWIMHHWSEITSHGCKKVTLAPPGAGPMTSKIMKKGTLDPLGTPPGGQRGVRPGFLWIFIDFVCISGVQSAPRNVCFPVLRPSRHVFSPVFLGRVFDRDLIEKMIEKSTPGTLVGLHRRVRIAYSHFFLKCIF